MAKCLVTKRVSFEAAHFLPDYNGACSHMHGHSYRLEVTVQGEIQSNGMVIDFKQIKEMINQQVLSLYDHALINDTPHFRSGLAPTAENMAVVIFSSIEYYLKGTDVELVSVKLWETEDCYVEYRGE
jgi:6-pyruvoyltetrahydropterin/6-carboxytetrahydropterin synthase